MSPRPTKNRSKRTGLIGVHINLPAELIAAYDRRVEALGESDTWPKITRTDLIRNVLFEGAKGWEPAPVKEDV